MSADAATRDVIPGAILQGEGQNAAPGAAQGRVVVHSTLIIRREGSIPDPHALAQFGSIDPSFPREILEMAKREQASRHAAESRRLSLEEKGQLFAFILALFAISMSILAAYLKEPWVAGILGGSTVLGLVTVFITGRILERQKQDEDDKTS
ncbi:MAG: DUF2335 domain-containing protein [Magnetococcales bacterium]|nr:DUF2335 domain-containing protein [Magnetococcales bacterium]